VANNTGTESPDLIKVYIPPSVDFWRHHIDACIMENALQFLYKTGCEALATTTEEFLFDWLLSNKYLHGAWHYFNPLSFLYFFAKAIVQKPEVFERFKDLVLSHVMALYQ
jgi:hypothetical protein